MAPRKRNNNKSRAKRNGNRKNNVTNRQRFNTTSNGLSIRGSVRRPMINKFFVESGSDFLGPLTVLANPATIAARVIHAGAISPSAFLGTRLTQLSNLWERYRFRKFRLRWVPAVPKTLACQLIVYQDTDPLDDPTIITNADALIRQATAQAGSQQFNFINAMSIDLAKRADDQLYYTGPLKENERFSRQGNFYVIQVTNPIDMNGAPLSQDIIAGSIYVDWICEFQTAQINPSAVIETAIPSLATSTLSTPVPIHFPASVPVSIALLRVADPIAITVSRVLSDLVTTSDYTLDITVNSLPLYQFIQSVTSLTTDSKTFVVLLPTGNYTIKGTCSIGTITLTTFVLSYIMSAGGTPPSLV